MDVPVMHAAFPEIPCSALSALSINATAIWKAYRSLSDRIAIALLYTRVNVESVESKPDVTV